MKLYDRLNEIEKNHELNKHLKLRVYCTDSDIVEGYFAGYTDALNNEPEITQLEMHRFKTDRKIVCILENEIKSIEVIERRWEKWKIRF